MDQKAAEGAKDHVYYLDFCCRCGIAAAQHELLNCNFEISEIFYFAGFHMREQCAVCTCNAHLTAPNIGQMEAGCTCIYMQGSQTLILKGLRGSGGIDVVNISRSV